MKRNSRFLQNTKISDTAKKYILYKGYEPFAQVASKI